ncbi:hypothetical protein THAPS_263048 [Thalassiosira pseudonana CCMP1335]|uniref:Uncharacterized protein n=1 Tax=Thalassiosira pseudonana TaxID=35128 RepID=B5YP24_THAPS|nr:hypothetical protein THAPS_263048 [Thalassiosira pseudonana CCMP1335]ACI64381.1 hypothetical protein THAPS_263048 [Thalassiosira pseudonana CCMP1335]
MHLKEQQIQQLSDENDISARSLRRRRSHFLILGEDDIKRRLSAPCRHSDDENHAVPVKCIETSPSHQQHSRKNSHQKMRSSGTRVVQESTRRCVLLTHHTHDSASSHKRGRGVEDDFLNASWDEITPESTPQATATTAQQRRPSKLSKLTNDSGVRLWCLSNESKSKAVSVGKAILEKFTFATVS